MIIVGKWQQKKKDKREQFKPFKRTQVKVKNEEPVVYNLLRKEEIKNMEESQFNNRVCGLNNGVVYDIEYDDEKIHKETFNGWCN